jgi:hypothetical protein
MAGAPFSLPFHRFNAAEQKFPPGINAIVTEIALQESK